MFPPHAHVGPHRRGDKPHAAPKPHQCRSANACCPHTHLPRPVLIVAPLKYASSRATSRYSPPGPVRTRPMIPAMSPPYKLKMRGGVQTDRDHPPRREDAIRRWSISDACSKKATFEIRRRGTRNRPNSGGNVECGSPSGGYSPLVRSKSKDHVGNPVANPAPLRRNNAGISAASARSEISAPRDAYRISAAWRTSPGLPSPDRNIGEDG